MSHADQAQSAFTVACHVGTEIGFEVRLDGAPLYPSIYPQLLQSMCKLAVPAPRAAALVKEVIAPACVEVIWQVSLHTVWHTVWLAGIIVCISRYDVLRISITYGVTPTQSVYTAHMRFTS